MYGIPKPFPAIPSHFRPSRLFLTIPSHFLPSPAITRNPHPFPAILAISSHPWPSLAIRVIYQVIWVWSGDIRVGSHLVGRVCSAMSRRINSRSAECVPPHPVSIFRSAECVLPHPWSFSGRQSVFCTIPGQFPVGRVCSTMSRVDFR